MPPAGATDTHFHIFGPGPGQVRDPRAAYGPMDAPVEGLRAMHRAIGITHGVLVQNTAVQVNYDAFIAELGANPNFAGVAVIDDRTTDAELARLHTAGVRGVRFHFVEFLKKRPPIDVFHRSVRRAAELGWHVVVHVEPSDLVELRETFAAIPTTLIIDHISHIEPALSVEQPAFQALLALHRQENVWVKLANSDRWSRTGPPTYADAVPLGRSLVAHAPDRLIWGTDWPHVMYRNPRVPGDPPPDEANLMNLLYDFADDDAAIVKQILVDNPRRLYPLGS